MNIGILIGIFIAGFVFSKLKGFIFKSSIKTLYNNKVDDKTKEELADLYEKGILTIKEYKKKLGASLKEVFPDEKVKEHFEFNKLRKWWDLTDGVEWIKSIKEILDLRKLVIYGIILSSIFAYGWYQGKQGTPINIDLGYGKEAKIILNGEYLHIDKEGNTYLRDTKTDKIIKQISVKDIPNLKKKLAPIGFQFEPIFVAGIGTGITGADTEIGAGVSWLRYWKWKLESFITTKGIYPLATSYQITDNSGVGIGIGKGFEDLDNRIIIYYRFKF